jgi:hypothetical protein
MIALRLVFELFDVLLGTPMFYTFKVSRRSLWVFKRLCFHNRYTYWRSSSQKLCITGKCLSANFQMFHSQHDRYLADNWVQFISGVAIVRAAVIHCLSCLPAQHTHTWNVWCNSTGESHRVSNLVSSEWAVGNGLGGEVLCLFLVLLCQTFCVWVPWPGDQQRQIAAIANYRNYRDELKIIYQLDICDAMEGTRVEIYWENLFELSFISVKISLEGYNV